MLLNRCPVCHTHLTLDAMTSDAAARDALLLFASQPDDLAHALLSYLSLWRPLKRDLSYARTLKLAKEALALAEPGQTEALAQAMGETVATLRAKAAAGAGSLPITSHNYLKQVLKGLASPVCDIVQTDNFGNLPALYATEVIQSAVVLPQRMRRAAHASAMSQAAQSVDNARARYAE
ncbi:hypothetical protein [Rhodoferax sp.]|uniref:hypothetical protein n=1 Tax=Rhodoferax sp. TaxID=50421 RepID=UPI002636505D|nr:hypothetical protein [Rhodoferax sp.]MDD3938025.1 hypothetical protein [Rhodoferax sp.]